MNQFPKWKIKFFKKKQRVLYMRTRIILTSFLKNNPLSSESFEFSDQKFEWNCSGAPKTFDDKIIQFRPLWIKGEIK